MPESSRLQRHELFKVQGCDGLHHDLLRLPHRRWRRRPSWPLFGASMTTMTAMEVV